MATRRRLISAKHELFPDIPGNTDWACERLGSAAGRRLNTFAYTSVGQVRDVHDRGLRDGASCSLRGKE